jgi:ferric-dicitrate binding protein FerR (iron transport regulator)
MTDEVDPLLSAFLDGSISRDELAAIETRLTTDAQFADYFARWCLTHRQIIELLAESQLHRLMDQFVTTSPGLPKKTKRNSGISQAADAGQLSLPSQHENSYYPADDTRSTRLGALTLGMLTAIVAGVVYWLLPGFSKPDQAVEPTAQAAATQEPAAQKDAPIVATLTQIVDAIWAPDAAVFSHGQPLREGSHIMLASGMAKVTFDCGAEIALQGPCDFVIRDRMVGVLREGRITANVPRRAFSFAILSPQVDFVDLGTSFGVSVGEDERTELHVFEGEVLCSQSKQQDGERTEAIHVAARKAIEFGAPSGLPSDIAMDEEQFAGLFALRRAADNKSVNLIGDKLTLWLAADVAVTTDDQQRVISWQDIDYGDNESAEDALQVEEDARPLLVEKGINGHRAIRFDGKSDFLLTTPLETTDDQTVLFVCQFTPNAYDKERRWGGQILNYDGPPSRYLSNTLEPGVLQIGEPLLEEEFRPTMLTGQVFAGFIGSAVVESGRVDAAQVGANSPAIVAFVYDYEYENGRAFLEINGRSYGEARAFAPQGITSRKIIGRHAWMQNYFHGDLAELLIFNKALTADELARTTTYLANKYGITLAD